MIPLNTQMSWITTLQKSLAATVCVGVALFFVWPYRMSRAEMARIERHITDVDAELVRNEEAARDLPAIEREVQRLREQISRGRRLPDHQELPQFIRDITKLSQADRLDQFRYQPDVQRKQLLCAELPVTLTFEGKFADVATFLREAEQMSRLTRTRKLQLKAKDGKDGGVTAQLSMNIYFMDRK